MLFHSKNNTAKWKGRNLFSYSVGGMSQVVSTKRVLALVGRCKVVASNFPTEINSNGNNFNRQKSIFKANAAMYVCQSSKKATFAFLLSKKVMIITPTT